jgi:hypothetical protein
MWLQRIRYWVLLHLKAFLMHKKVFQALVSLSALMQSPLFKFMPRISQQEAVMVLQLQTGAD